MNDPKKFMIAEAIDSGDWTTTGSLVSRNDLMEYIMSITAPQLDKNGIRKKIKTPKVPCPICGKSTAPYTITFSRRQLVYLFSLIFLSKKKMDEEGDEYVHHKVINHFCNGMFKTIKGVNKGRGIDFTSYSPSLTNAPWYCMQKRDDVTDGCYKPTEFCFELCRGHIQFPETIDILNREIVRFSQKKIYAHQAKDVNFQELLDYYKTF